MSIFDEPSRKPLPVTPEIADHGTAIIKGTLGSIPIFGSALAEEMGLLFAPPLSRRRNDWLKDLARRLHDLEGKVDGFKFDDLPNNDQFLSAMLEATTSAAMRTHQKEKLEAFRNRVLNTAIPGAPDENRRLVFLSLIDRSAPAHLQILKKLDNPSNNSQQWAQEANLQNQRGPAE